MPGCTRLKAARRWKDRGEAGAPPPSESSCVRESRRSRRRCRAARSSAARRPGRVARACHWVRAEPPRRKAETRVRRTWWRLRVRRAARAGADAAERSLEIEDGDDLELIRRRALPVLVLAPAV